MAQLLQTFLRASSSTLGFNTPVIDITGYPVVYLETVVTCTAANLIADFTIGGRVEPQGQLRNADSGTETTGVLITALPTGWSFNSGFQVAVNNPAIGTTKIITRHQNMPRYMGSFYSFGSGGGTVSIVVTMWGWGKATTP